MKLFTAFLLAALLQPSISTYSLNQCTDQNGYSFSLHVDLVEASIFNINDLTNYFRSIKPLHSEGDWIYTLTSDRDLYANLTTKIYLMPLSFQRDIARVHHTDKPFARMHKIADNRFFEYKMISGEIGWVVLKGSNVLYPLSDSSMMFIGYKIWDGLAEDRCRNGQRIMQIVIKDLDKMPLKQLIEICRHYEDVFPTPEIMAIKIYQSLSEASYDHAFSMPCIVAMDGYGIRYTKPKLMYEYTRYAKTFNKRSVTRKINGEVVESIDIK